MKRIFVFDCESDGLYGEVFAVGAIVMNENGKILDSFSAIAEKEKVKNEWVRENVLPHLEGLKFEFKTKKELRDAFF